MRKGDLPIEIENTTHSIHWPGGRTGPPPDTPKCGFDGSLCRTDDGKKEFFVKLVILFQVSQMVCKH